MLALALQHWTRRVCWSIFKE